MNHSIFVVGGCKCGKSSHALALAQRLPSTRKVFVATCRPLDGEMELRVARHQQERDGSWDTVEEPLKVPEALARHARDGALVLVDCLTLWISNMLMEGFAEKDVERRALELMRSITGAQGPLILVSNEVGAGIVPENALARAFRDMAGKVNQQAAAACREVHWVVAGIPICIKQQGGAP